MSEQILHRGRAALRQGKPDLAARLFESLLPPIADSTAAIASPREDIERESRALLDGPPLGIDSLAEVGWNNC